MSMNYKPYHEGVLVICGISQDWVDEKVLVVVTKTSKQLIGLLGFMVGDVDCKVIGCFLVVAHQMYTYVGVALPTSPPTGREEHGLEERGSLVKVGVASTSSDLWQMLILIMLIVRLLMKMVPLLAYLIWKGKKEVLSITSRIRGVWWMWMMMRLL